MLQRIQRIFSKNRTFIIGICAILSLALLSANKPNKESLHLGLVIDARHPANKAIPNIASNINIWQMGNTFVNPSIEFSEYNEFQFVKWVQLMLCSGGSESRDLFKNPDDRTTTEDYNFDLLIRNCEGILKLGAKPFLKLGAVPLKLTTEPKINSSGFNIYPPDSYEQYYQYIKAIAVTLVSHFGKKEVASWRFGCLDEYENGNIFRARSGDPEDSFVAYCKMYDYTVQALTDVLGDNIFVGAHSMSVLDGQWDECRFIEHAAKGRNYANGSNGTKIRFLSVSFYDNSPGNLSYRTLANTIRPLQDKAKECNLDNIIYGVDEGRVLSGTQGSQSSSLNSRASGYTWQAAEDARLFSQAIDLGLDYFSAWSYLTGGNTTGYPTVSYHVAENIAKFAGFRRINVNYPVTKDRDKDKEIGCIAGVKKDTILLMIYSFSTDIHSKETDEISLDFLLPYNSRKAKVVKWLVNDDCNYFDEWQADRQKYNIKDEAFLWSPDDGQVEASIILYDSEAKKIYREQLRDKYIKCSELRPEINTVRIQHRKYSEIINIACNTVLFMQITKR